ncbi:hypothetical protein GCM10011348_16070 [Marinobacterium nitratireducens]|uniref:EF-hand domain-containing protein n=1 Tax=Marinobacterium nitratireducens TaxID=518897 RepID=A0A917ZCS1_9GAMM|nr:Ig-like domain-containing protein [Marinobacterium nitratireducens]GGO80107.1 hypothetical protein GCM10011348_16070 [Marinobacterium nitratireducens]
MQRFRYFRAHHSARTLSLIAPLGLALCLSGTALAGKPTSAKGNRQGADNGVSTPLALSRETYQFRNLSGDNSCLGEDDHLIWEAIGDLAPGESFTFTPKYPACNYHPAAISVQLSWAGSELELSSTVPYDDFSSSNSDQTGMDIVATRVGNSAQLCMFPNYKEAGIYYSVTLTNTGDTLAENIVVDGRSENDWAVFYYNRCMNADGDADGWNDSLEHTMANLVRYVTSSGGESAMNTVWGPNYLKSQPSTMSANDEIDSYPADVNDDGQVDQLDIDRISQYLGQGNGIPLAAISANPGDPGYLYLNTHKWRRFDLDADGYVSQTDVDIVASLMGYPMPMTEDIIAPTARILSPANGSIIARGGLIQIEGHAWDNAAIARVDYIADGQVICSATEPSPVWGATSPFHNCWWDVPKKQGDHIIEIQVFDAAGNMSTSESVQVLAQ